MLNIGKIRSDSIDYLTDAVAQGSEDYYSGSGEAPGVWLGAGAVSLGLEGEVTADELHRLLAGQHPETGETLRSTGASIPGFDLTLRAPKSVSILWGLGSPEVATAVREAHDAAVRDAIAHMEMTACHVRRGHAGAVREQGSGFIAAAYRHRTSRAGDPTLHTHVAVANMSQGPDGRWTSLVHPELYREARAAGSIYQAALRRHLTATLGVEWSEVVNGYADIAGIDDGLIELFSKRRQEILAEMQARGEHSAAAAQAATLSTRRPKPGHRASEWSPEAGDYGVPPAGVETLQTRWEAEAAAAGYVLDEPGILHRRGVASLDDDARAVLIARLLGPSGLTEMRAAFRRKDIVEAVCQALPAGSLTVAEIEALVDEVLAAEAVVPLDVGQAGADPASWYSTEELLGLEASVLASARTRADAGVAQVPPEALDGVLAGRTLSDEQARMVRRLCSDGAGLDTVVGRGGSGKTYALGIAREAWDAAGVPVLGCALAARAAQNLEAESGIQSTTVRSVVTRLRRGEALPQGTVVVVDEAGMVGTRDLAVLARAAEAVSGKVVLVGDYRQLSEIEAGGIFRTLGRSEAAIQLLANRRQTDEGEREALDELRHGTPRRYLTWATEHGRITLATSPDDLVARMADDWWSGVEADDPPLVLAYRRADVRQLNVACRAKMRQAGRLGEEELEVGQPPKRGQEDRRRIYSVGDRIVLTKTVRWPEFSAVNGTVGTVAVVDPAAGGLSMVTDAGELVTVPRAYLDGGFSDHAYAATGHKAQGQTVAKTLVLIDDLASREWVYTAASRAKEGTQIYVVEHSDIDTEAWLESDDREADERLIASLATSDAQRSARSQLRAPGIDRLARVRELAGRPMVELVAERDSIERGLAPSLGTLSRTRQTVLERLASAEAAHREALERFASDRSSAPAAMHAKVAAQRLQRARERAAALPAEALTAGSEHGDELARLAEVRAAIRRQAGVLARAMADSGVALDGLGPCPEGRRERREWLRAAARQVAPERAREQAQERVEVEEEAEAQTQ